MVFLALFIYKILEGSIQEFWGVEATLFVNTDLKKCTSKSIIAKPNLFFLKVV